MDLAEKLKYFRKKSHLTQQQVADAIGIERSAYSYYELRKTNPKIETLQMLAKLYNTNVDLLLDNNDDRDEEDILSSPDRFEEWYVDDKFNQLSDYEQAILLRVRLLSVKNKKKTLEYIDSLFENEE